MKPKNIMKGSTVISDISPKSWMKIAKENMVSIVGVSLIIGIHWGWWKLQQNPALVDPKDRRDLPIYTVYKELKAKIVGENVSEAATGSETK